MSFSTVSFIYNLENKIEKEMITHLYIQPKYPVRSPWLFDKSERVTDIYPDDNEMLMRGTKMKIHE